MNYGCHANPSEGWGTGMTKHFQLTTETNENHIYKPSSYRNIVISITILLSRCLPMLKQHSAYCSCCIVLSTVITFQCLVFLELYAAEESTATTTPVTRRIDSLHRIVVTTHDTSRVKALYALGETYLFQSIDSAERYYQRGLALAESIQMPIGVLEGLIMCGYILDNRGKYFEALDSVLRALSLAETLHNGRYRGIAFHAIGNIYKRQGTYEVALHYYQMSLQECINTGNCSGIAAEHAVCAEVKFLQQDNNAAIDLGNKTLQIMKECQQHWNEARFTPQYVLGIAHNTIGFAYLAQHSIDSAMNHFADALNISYDKAILSKAQCGIGLANAYQGKTQKAMYFGDQGMRLALEVGRKDYIRDSYWYMANIFASLTKYDSAYYYYQRHIELKEALNKEQIAEKMAHLSQLQERERREYEQKQQTFVQYGLGGVCILAVAFAGLMASRYRLKHRSEDALQAVNAQLNEANEELQHQNKALMELSKEKDELLGIAAHDLKNPLSGILSIADTLLLYSNEISETNKHQLLQSIVRSSERMFRLISNLLSINAIERGGMTLQLMSLNVKDCVDSVVNDYKLRAEQKGITLQLIGNDTTFAQADEAALVEVLENIISNAVKYSPQGKNIWISVSPQAAMLTHQPSNSNDQIPMIRISVRDEGPGISADDRLKLFGKFSRLSARPTGGEHSTGLGLSIVKGIVEAMNGRVWCQSEVGEGATFIMELPAAPFVSQTAPESADL